MRSDAPVLFLWLPQCHGNAFPDASDKKNGPLSRSAAFLPRCGKQTKTHHTFEQWNFDVSSFYKLPPSSPLPRRSSRMIRGGETTTSTNFRPNSKNSPPFEGNLMARTYQLRTMKLHEWAANGTSLKEIWSNWNSILAIFIPLPRAISRFTRIVMEKERERERERERHYIKSDIPILNFHRIRGNLFRMEEDL